MKQKLPPISAQSTPTIRFVRKNLEVRLPTRGTSGSIGLDLYADIRSENNRANNILIPSLATRPVPTGLCCCLDDIAPWTLLVCSRSGMAAKSIFVANSPGIIDPDYQGELMVLLYNGSHTSYYVQHGDRVAQLLLVRSVYAIPEFVIGNAEFSERGSAGLGSTGR